MGRITIALICLLLTASCGHAEMVERTQRGGLIAISGPFMPSMRSAHGIMLEHCDGPYNVKEQGTNPVTAVKFQCK